MSEENHRKDDVLRSPIEATLPDDGGAQISESELLPMAIIVRDEAHEVLAEDHALRETQLGQPTKHDSLDDERQRFEAFCVRQPINVLMNKVEKLRKQKSRSPILELYLQVMQAAITNRLRHLDFNAYHTFLGHLRALGYIHVAKDEEKKGNRKQLFDWQKIVCGALERRNLQDRSDILPDAVIEILKALEDSGEINEVDEEFIQQLRENGDIVGDVRDASEARLGVIFHSFQAMKMMEEMDIVDWGLKNTEENGAAYSLNPWLLQKAVGKRPADDLSFPDIVKRVYKKADEDGPTVKNHTLYDALLAEKDPEAVLSYCQQLQRNRRLLSVMTYMDRWLPSKITGIANILIRVIMELNSSQQ